MAWSGRGSSHRPRVAEGPPVQGQHPMPQHATHGGPAGARYRSTSRVSEIDVWDNLQNDQLQGDSSSSDGDLHPRSHPSRPRHTRSVSHPFPSLFWGRKKKTSPMADDEESGSDSDGGGSNVVGKPPPVRGHRNGSSTGSRDFVTGRCMTCGSLVRWPGELQMFRCTICLTVNDLQPADRAPRREGAAEVAVIDEQSGPKGMDAVIPCSTGLSLND